MAIVGEAFVEIHTITDAVAKEIRQGLSDGIKGEGTRHGKTYGEEFGDASSQEIESSQQETGNKLTRAYQAIGDKVGKAFAEKFAAATGKLNSTATLDGDDARLQGKIAAARRNLEELAKMRVNPQVDLDIKALEAKKKLAENQLEALRKMDASPKVDADITALEAKIGRFTTQLQKLNDEKINPKIDVDIAKAAAELSALEAQLTRVAGTHRVRVDADSKSVVDATNALGLFVRTLASIAVPAGLILLTPYIASLGAAAVAAAGSLYLIPAAMGAAGLAIGTLIAGFAHLSDALGPAGTPAQIKKVNEALASLSPNARATALVIRGLSDEWENLRTRVQDKMFEGVSKEVSALAQIYLPILLDAMLKIAGAFNKAFLEISSFLKQKENVGGMTTAFGQISTAVATIVSAFGPLFKAFSQIFIAGAPFLQKFADWVLQLSTRFAAFIDTASGTGQLTEIIQQALDVLKQLLDVASGGGGILSSIFEAAQQSGTDTIGVVSALTDVVDEFLQTDAGKAGLNAIFTTLKTVVEALTPGIVALGQAVAEGVIALGPSLGPVAKAIADIVIALAPLVPDLATLASVILPPLAAVLSLISPLLGPIAAGFLAILATNAITGFIATTTIALEAFTIAQLGVMPAAVASSGAFGILGGAIRAVGAAIMANPIGIIVTALIGLGAALIYCYNHFEGFRNVVDAVFGFFRDIVMNVINWFTGTIVPSFGKAIDDVVGFFRDLPTNISNFLSNLGADIAKFFTDAMNAAGNAVSAGIDGIIYFFQNLPRLIGVALGFIAGVVARFFVDAFVAAVDAVVTGFNNVVKFFQEFPDRAKAFLVQGGISFVKWAEDTLASIGTAFSTGFEAVITFFRELPGKALDLLIGFGISLVKGGQDAGKGFLDGILTIGVGMLKFFTELPGKVGSFFASAGSWLLDAGKNVIQGLLDGLIGGVLAIVHWIEDFIGGIIDGFKAGFGIASPSTVFFDLAGNIIAGLLNGLLAGIQAIFDFFAGLGQKIAGFFQAGLDIIGQVWTNFWAWLNSITGGAFDGIRQVIENVWNIVVAIFNTFTALLTGDWQGFWDGLRSIGEAIWTAISSYFQVIWDGIRIIFETVWNAISAVATTVWNFISSFFANALAGFSTSWDAVWNAVSAVFSTIWNAISSTATTIWNAITSFLTAGINAFSSVWNSVWNAISTLFTTIWNVIQTTVTTIWNAISAFLNTALNIFKASWDAIWNAVRTLFETVWNAIQAFVMAIWEAIKQFFAAALAAFNGDWGTAWNLVQSAFETIWNAIKAFGETIWNAIKAFFETALNVFQTAWDAAWNAIKTLFETVWNAIKDAATTIWNAIKAFFEGAFTAFTTFFSNTWNNIVTDFENILNGIVGIATNIWETVKGVFRDGLNAIIHGVNWPIEKINDLFGIGIPTIPDVNFATGGALQDAMKNGVSIRANVGSEGLAGRVRGLAGSVADRVPAALSAEEHVWSGKEVRGAGGHAGVRALRQMARDGLLPGLASGGAITSQNMPDTPIGAYVIRPEVADQAGAFLRALNSGQTEAMQATGRGRNLGRYQIPRFAAGGQLQAGIDFARAQNGKPYVWGGVGPGGYDCSGFQSAITNVLRGGNPHSRVGTTDTFPWGGFTSGLTSAYAVGAKHGNPGHMAGTLGGNNVESGGSPSMTKFVQSAAGADSGQFPIKASLPEIGGAFAGGGGIFDPAAWFDSIAGAFGLPEIGRDFVRDITPNLNENFFDPQGVGLFDKGWEGLRKTAIDLISSIFGGVDPGVPAATGPVQDQVKAIAKQYGWDSGPEWNAISQIVQKESGWNPNAANPNSSARGLFQKMTSIHGAVEPTAGGQASWGLNYIKERYGTPSKALAYWNAHGNYDSGGFLAPGTTLATNGTGKPEMIAPHDIILSAFQDAFKWFGPLVEKALSNGQEKIRTAVSQGQAYAQKLIAKIMSGRGDVNTPGAGGSTTTNPSVPIVTLPPDAIPPVTIPELPPIALPTADIGTALKNALAQFAPELTLAMESGAKDQTVALAKAIQQSPERMAAITDAVSQAIGEPFVGLGEDLSVIIAQNMPASEPVAPAPPGTGGAGLVKNETMGGGTQANKSWLENFFGNVSSVPGQISQGFGHTAQVVQQTVFGGVGSFAPTNASTSALDNLPSTIDQVAANSTSAMAQAAADAAPKQPAAINVDLGGVTVQGNADSVTVKQLQGALADFGSAIVREVEART